MTFTKRLWLALLLCLANPTDNVKEAAKRKRLQKAGNWNERLEDRYQDRQSNQSIISGTCGYGFEHFASYWKKYKSTIQTKGDFKKQAELETKERI